MFAISRLHNRVYNRLLLLLLPFLLAATASVAWAAEPPADTDAPPATLSVNGVGVANARPDVAYIHLGVDTTNDDAGAAIDENNARTEAVMVVLEEMGVAAEAVQTVNYGLWVEQIYGKEGEPTEEIRYHVNNQMRVKLSDQRQLGELLQRTMAAGVNSVGGISFQVADPKKLAQRARALAIADATAKAEQLADGFGVELGSIRQVSEFSSPGSGAEMPTGEGRGVGGGGPVPIAGGQFSVSIQIQVVFDLIDTPNE